MLLTNLCLFSCQLFAAYALAQSFLRSSHKWMTTEESQIYNDVAGNSKLPSYNQFIHPSGLATEFHADQAD